MNFIKSLFGKKNDGIKKVDDIPDNYAVADEHIKKAMEYIAKNDWGNAITHLKLAEKIAPQDPSIHIGFFIAYSASSDLASTKKHFRILKKLDAKAANDLLSGLPKVVQDVIKS